MVYFDTSFLAPLILTEATSAAVEAFIAGLPIDALAISHWTRVEFSSLLARQVRMGGLESAAAGAAEARFEAMVGESFAVILPTADDFGLAKTYLAIHETGLRAGDALHLAVARNHHAAAIYCLDKTMIRAGASLGLPTLTGIETGV